MRRMRVIIGMAGLIVLFHMIYFDFRNLKASPMLPGRENDHVKVTELRINETCEHCQTTLREYLAFGS